MEKEKGASFVVEDPRGVETGLQCGIKDEKRELRKAGFASGDGFLEDQCVEVGVCSESIGIG